MLENGLGAARVDRARAEGGRAARVEAGLGRVVARERQRHAGGEERARLGALDRRQVGDGRLLYAIAPPAAAPPARARGGRRRGTSRRTRSSSFDVSPRPAAASDRRGGRGRAGRRGEPRRARRRQRTQEHEPFLTARQLGADLGAEPRMIERRRSCAWISAPYCSRSACERRQREASASGDQRSARVAAGHRRRRGERPPHRGSGQRARRGEDQPPGLSPRRRPRLAIRRPHARWSARPSKSTGSCCAAACSSHASPADASASARRSRPAPANSGGRDS